MEFLKFLQFEIKRPEAYGLFHIVSLVLVVVLTAILCIFCRNIKEKLLSKVLMIIWVILILLEIYKQFIFSYSISGDNSITWHYQWYAFPYQFCATPLTFIPFIALNKASNKVSAFIKEGAITFCSTFNLFAGLAVMAYPNNVFMSYLGIDIHTMIHHGMQVVLGIFIYVYYHGKLNYWSYLKSLVVFAFFLTNAMIMNEIMYPILKESGETFNMFYISSHYTCELPILIDIQPKVPYLVFLMLYVIGFTIVGFIVYNINYWITWLINRQKPKVIDKFDNTILDFVPKKIAAE